MRILTTTIVLILTLSAGGCSTARGLISGVRELGNGLLIDAEGAVDGIAAADAARGGAK